ncbi:hypothetical protein L083_3045 [Actinoplanes sp. N902-109]|nr:hypothetical protein L083_3045 [Actinoplanes sp. N902-109]
MRGDQYEPPQLPEQGARTSRRTVARDVRFPPREHFLLS